MQSKEDRRRNRNKWIDGTIAVLCVVTVLLDFIEIAYSSDIFQNRMIGGIVQQACGGIAAILVMIRLKIKLFGKPQNWLYLIPGLVIAIDNFPFWSYFSGNMQFLSLKWTDYALFALYHLSIGVFEECIFRGIIFAVLAGSFSKDRKGFWQTYLCSSLIFGGAHLLNVFNGAGFGETLLQVGYTILTGGLFAFAVIKTKNIFCTAVVHAIYNICGLLLSEQGLGTGIVFDAGTTVIMAIVSVIVGVFVLYHIWKISEEERSLLYVALGVNSKSEK